MGGRRIKGTLTAMMQKFVDGIEMGLFPVQAAQAAGYKNPGVEAPRLVKDSVVRAELERIAEQNRKEMAMTREKVQQIVIDGIEMGRTMADPMAMIRGAQELNKMCGFYAPEIKKFELGASQRRLQTKYEEMPTDKLLEALGEVDFLEGEYEELDEE